MASDDNLGWILCVLFVVVGICLVSVDCQHCLEKEGCPQGTHPIYLKGACICGLN